MLELLESKKLAFMLQSNTSDVMVAGFNTAREIKQAIHGRQRLNSKRT